MSRPYRNISAQFRKNGLVLAMVAYSLISFTVITASGGEEPKAAAEKSEVKLGSPHETMLSFVESMVAYREHKKAKRREKRRDLDSSIHNYARRALVGRKGG